jgi:hypothetical protein
MLAAHSASSSSGMCHVVCDASASRRSSRLCCSAGLSSKQCIPTTTPPLAAVCRSAERSVRLQRAVVDHDIVAELEDAQRDLDEPPFDHDLR